jgi:hypothetical protein
MNEVKRYLITYKQKFWEEVITDKYVVYDTYEGVCEREFLLYEDPHVISVDIKELYSEVQDET